MAFWHEGPRDAQRLPLLIPAMLSLLAGLWLGAIRVGWELPSWSWNATRVHGPLMVAGFLGTLIALERAVALGRAWAYLAPLCSGIGALLTIALPRALPGPWLLMTGATLLTVASLVVWRKQPSLHLAVMAAGAAGLVTALALWLSGTSIVHALGWWTSFPLLTIIAERLELNRLMQPSAFGKWAFRGALVVLATGLGIGFAAESLGLRTVGLAWLVLALWLLQYDVARRTIRGKGLTRFIAVCLLGGYGWLGFAGVLALAVGEFVPGPQYDAVLHAIFVGFTFSMILGHAPVIFPAVLGWRMPFHRGLYLPVVVLHGTLLLRVIGNLSWWIPGRQWGGLGNVLAVLLFVAITAGTVWRGRSAGKASAPPQ